MPMQFTHDWFKPHIPVWERFISPALRDRPAQCLEIGSFEGRSATWLLQHALQHHQAKLTCVDIWAEAFHERRFVENIEKTGQADKVRRIKSPSTLALKNLHGPFDFIYIDGSHEARDVLTDAVMSWPLLCDGGIMAFDDYRWKDHSVRRQPAEAINCFLQLWEDCIKVLHHDWQVIVTRHRDQRDQSTDLRPRQPPV